jgi:hypothetical protein
MGATVSHEQFLTSKDSFRLKNELGPHLRSTSITKLCLLKDWKAFVEYTGQYTIKTTDGTDFLKIKEDQEQQSIICDMNGDVLGVLPTEMQDESIIGSDGVWQQKHLYVYSLKPYNTENTVRSGLVSNGKPLHHWARVHAEPTLVGRPTKFQVTLAKNKLETAQTPIMNMFHVHSYTAKFRKDGRCAMKDLRGRGAVVVDFSEDDPESWTVSIAANSDPVFLLCAVLQLQQLVTQLKGNIVYHSSTMSADSEYTSFLQSAL